MFQASRLEHSWGLLRIRPRSMLSIDTYVYNVNAMSALILPGSGTIS